ncbi:hypothetical protein LUZ60_013240 [Juncus effusus]|nr:hypothetical protein LUZ60_013240 [Juncus effusus]
MASGSRSFNFGTDDVLCSYDDCAPQDSSGSLRSDPPSKEFQDSRMARPLVNIYEQDNHSSTDNFTSIVERCMKKYADTLMRSLDGISGRLAQLEMHCYKVERSVGELRGDMMHGQSQTDGKFKSLEKHMQEVHRAVQIMRDKQELADAQKELAKLQMLQKESTEPARTPTPVQESTKHEDSPKQKQISIPNNQLALVPSVQQQPQQVSLPQSQLPQLPLQQQDGNNQYVANHTTASYQSLPAAPAGYQYVQTRPQLQEIPPVQPQIVQQMAPKPAPFPQYQQQWAPQNPNPQQFTAQPNPNPQQFAAQPNPNPQQFTGQPNPNPTPQQFAGQPSQQTQLRPQMPVQGYSTPTYPHPQPSNPIPETYPTSIPIPPSYSNPSQSSYGMGNQGNTRLSQPPPNQISKGGYANVPPYSMQGPMQSSNYNAGSYGFPQNNVMPRNSPYGEFIEKAVSMGYPRDQVVSVAMKMAESGQHMDLNALLDRLNGVY